MEKLAAIIPFYQKEAGILEKSIRSVLNQNLPDGIKLWIILIDDVSPINVSDEMESISIPDDVEVTIHYCTENGGPGAARNIGLDLACRKGASYVAFIDSDDIWIKPHLPNAIAMLASGSEVYFSDHRRVDDYESAFEAGAPLFWNSPKVRSARAHEIASHGLFRLDAEFVRSSLIHEYVFQTSTVVFRLKEMCEVRFDTRLRSAGEDHLFWFDLASAAQSFAVSSTVETECGYGVNIYFSNFSWNSPRAEERFAYRYMMFKEMKSRGFLDRNDLKHINAKSREMLRYYMYIFFRNILTKNPKNWNLFKVVVSMIWR